MVRDDFGIHQRLVQSWLPPGPQHTAHLARSEFTAMKVCSRSLGPSVARGVVILCARRDGQGFEFRGETLGQGFIEGFTSAPKIAMKMKHPDGMQQRWSEKLLEK